ncbi:hypothetical protein [Streptomyces cremeus]|uniref:Uncharacterized protein n=1 Tax=Streptomyces cremeus TaxID=66881 RepID=A0ABV5PJI1_STRCM
MRDERVVRHDRRPVGAVAEVLLDDGCLDLSRDHLPGTYRAIAGLVPDRADNG